MLSVTTQIGFLRNHTPHFWGTRCGNYSTRLRSEGAVGDRNAFNILNWRNERIELLLEDGKGAENEQRNI